MKYTQLTNDYKYQHLANAIYAREVEYFHYDFDRINFEHMLKNLPDGDFKTNIEERIEDTKKQMNNVISVLNALKNQIDDEEQYEKAVKIVSTNREKSETK